MNLKLGRVAGVPIILTNNFLVYIGIFLLITAFQTGIASVGITALAIAAVASCILLHELGHVLVGQRFGVRTRNITLNFFGGIAGAYPIDWYRLMDRPGPALVIWLCGPLVNFVLAGLLTLAMLPLTSYPNLYADLAWIRTTNIVIGCFSLLPLYPTDGGGILYSICRFITTKQRAIRIASVVSMVGAVALLIAAIKFKLLMAGVIAAMIFFEAYRAPKSDLFR